MLRYKNQVKCEVSKFKCLYTNGYQLYLNTTYKNLKSEVCNEFLNTDQFALQTGTDNRVWFDTLFERGCLCMTEQVIWLRLCACDATNLEILAAHSWSLYTEVPAGQLRVVVVLRAGDLGLLSSNRPQGQTPLYLRSGGLSQLPSVS